MTEPIKTKTLLNPTSDDLVFKWDSATYVVKAGQRSEPFLKYIAEHGAKKLADKNVKTNNPQELEILVRAYIEESEPEVIAKNLGIDLAKIRKEAITKDKEKARVLNLEAQMLQMKEEMDEMKKKDAVKEEEEQTWNDIKAKARELDVFELTMKKDELLEAIKVAEDKKE